MNDLERIEAMERRIEQLEQQVEELAVKLGHALEGQNASDRRNMTSRASASGSREGK